MKKVIGVLSVATLALAMFLNTSLINKSNNNQSFNLASLLTTANAQVENNGGTGQAGKGTASKTESYKVYGKVDAGGSWVILSIGAEGGYEKTVSITYDCCRSGGNNCSTDNPDC